MARFNCVRAHSITQAVELLNELGFTSQLLAAGTNLMVYLRQKASWFDRLVAGVEVDLRTGKTEVNGFWAAHDLGKTLFPQGAYWASLRRYRSRVGLCPF